MTAGAERRGVTAGGIGAVTAGIEPGTTGSTSMTEPSSLPRFKRLKSSETFEMVPVVWDWRVAGLEAAGACSSCSKKAPGIARVEEDRLGFEASSPEVVDFVVGCATSILIQSL